MQKIKAYYYQIGEGTIKENFAIYSAFQLYLDFINVFLFILRILGNGRSRD
jgi:FtsH-binding integral membrane protein